MRKVLVLAIGLLLSGSAVAANNNPDEEICPTVEVSYVIKNEDGDVMHNLSLQRNWPLTCVEQTKLWYLFLDSTVGVGKKEMKATTGITIP